MGPRADELEAVPVPGDQQAVLPPGCVVQTTVREDYRADSLSRFDCELSLREAPPGSSGIGDADRNGKANGSGKATGPLATATMTVMSIPDMHAFFKH